MSTTNPDIMFADLAARATTDPTAAHALRQALVPACEAICAERSNDALLAAVVDAAYAEVMHWAHGELVTATSQAA